MLSAKNPEIKKAASILEVMSRSETDRLAFEARVAMLHDMATFREEGLEEGIAKGRAEEREEGWVEGATEKAMESAREAIKLDLPESAIIKITGLDTETVRQLKKELN